MRPSPARRWRCPTTCCASASGSSRRPTWSPTWNRRWADRPAGTGGHMTDPTQSRDSTDHGNAPQTDNLKEAWGEVGAKFGGAFEQLRAALRELGRKLTGVVNDDDLRDQAKQ